MKEGNRIELSQVREDPDGAAKNLVDELKVLDLYADGTRLKDVYVCSAKAAIALDLFCTGQGLNCPEPFKGFELPQEAESLQGLIAEHHLLQVESPRDGVRLGILGKELRYVLNRMFVDAGNYLRGIDLLPVSNS